MFFYCFLYLTICCNARRVNKLARELFPKYSPKIVNLNLIEFVIMGTPSGKLCSVK